MVKYQVKVRATAVGSRQIVHLTKAVRRLTGQQLRESKQQADLLQTGMVLTYIVTEAQIGRWFVNGCVEFCSLMDIEEFTVEKTVIDCTSND